MSETDLEHERFARLVGLACHDVRTPLATVYGFARTLARLDLEEPGARYVQMIEAASAQISELLDELGIVARIEGGRFEPNLEDVDSLELARGAAEELGDTRVAVEGKGASVRVDAAATRRAIRQLARAGLRHGGLEAISLSVRGTVLELSPLTAASTPVVLGEELRELGAASAAALIRALGGSLEASGDRLAITLPAGGRQ